jgi:hypothetical protein
MKIRITGQDGEGLFPFGDSGAWRIFKDTILDAGHQICGNSYQENADAIISNSFNSEINRFIENSRIPIEKRILVLWEPYVIEKIRYSREVLDKFGTVFAPSFDWAERIQGVQFNWPQSKIELESYSHLWEDRLNSAVMVQGNKYSARKGEMYSLRRRLLHFAANEELHLYGTDWNRGIYFDLSHWTRSLILSSLSDVNLKSIFGIGRRYDSYLGAVEDKKMTLQRYRISIVIENSADFVSEKLFDSIGAGCVTVYVGPSLEKYGIPEHSVIACKPEAKEIMLTIRGLLALPESRLEQIAIEQNRQIRTVATNWENNYVLKNLAKTMLRYLGK